MSHVHIDPIDLDKIRGDKIAERADILSTHIGRWYESMQDAESTMSAITEDMADLWYEPQTADRYTVDLIVDQCEDLLNQAHNLYGLIDAAERTESL